MVPDPSDTIIRYHKLKERQSTFERNARENQKKIAELDELLKLESKVIEALGILDSQLFKKITGLLEEKLTIALQEILEQNVCLKVEPSVQYKSLGFEFKTERNGYEEDIMKGNGGSVANILSVCLRLFALSTLDTKEHRRFLVLDEQDCWLQPELIPRFAKIIHEAARALKFQILMISHHSSSLFLEHADRIFSIEPTPEGVSIQRVNSYPTQADSKID